MNKEYEAFELSNEKTLRLPLKNREYKYARLLNLKMHIMANKISIMSNE